MAHVIGGSAAAKSARALVTMELVVCFYLYPSDRYLGEAHFDNDWDDSCEAELRAAEEDFCGSGVTLYGDTKVKSKYNYSNSKSKSKGLSLMDVSV